MKLRHRLEEAIKEYIEEELASIDIDELVTDAIKEVIEQELG